MVDLNRELTILLAEGGGGDIKNDADYRGDDYDRRLES